MSTQETIFGVAALAIGGFLFWKGFKRYGQYKLIKDTPTSKIRSLAMGIVEINGNAIANEAKYLKTPFSDTNCFAYLYEVKEYKKHTSTDSKGHTTTSYRWDTIARGRNETLFQTKDDTGNVIINPKNAELKINVRKVFLQKAGLFGNFTSIYSSLKMFDNGANSSFDVKKLNLIPIENSKISFGNRVGDRKFYEQYITDNDNLYILGTAANNASTNNKVQILKGENEPTFIISDKSEKSLLKKMGWGIAGFLIGGIALILLGLWLVLSSIGVS